MCSLSHQKFEAKIFEDTAYFEPYYLKDFVAFPSKNKFYLAYYFSIINFFTDVEESELIFNKYNPLGKSFTSIFTSVSLFDFCVFTTCPRLIIEILLYDS